MKNIPNLFLIKNGIKQSDCIKFPHQLLDNMRLFTPSEFKLISLIISETYGKEIEYFRVSRKDLKILNMCDKTYIKTLKSLIHRKILTINDGVRLWNKHDGNMDLENINLNTRIKKLDDELEGVDIYTEAEREKYRKIYDQRSDLFDELNLKTESHIKNRNKLKNVYGPFEKPTQYTYIPKILFEKHMNMTSVTWKVLLFMYRKTYGFNKDQDRISISQIIKNCGISKSQSIRALDYLQKNNYISCIVKYSSFKVGKKFKGYAKKWKILPIVCKTIFLPKIYKKKRILQYYINSIGNLLLLKKQQIELDHWIIGSYNWIWRARPPNGKQYL